MLVTDKGSVLVTWRGGCNGGGLREITSEGPVKNQREKESLERRELAGGEMRFCIERS